MKIWRTASSKKLKKDQSTPPRQGGKPSAAICDAMWGDLMAGRTQLTFRRDVDTRTKRDLVAFEFLVLGIPKTHPET